MDKHALLRSLSSQISELNDMVREMAQSGSIHQLDKDMFKNKIRILYEDALKLQKVDIYEPSKTSQQAEDPVSPKSVAPAPVKEDSPKPAKEDLPAPAKEAMPARPENYAPEQPKYSHQETTIQKPKEPSREEISTTVQSTNPPRQASRQQAPLFEPIPSKSDKTSSPTPEPVQRSTSDPRSLGDRLKPQKEAVNEIYGKAQSAKKGSSNPQPISDILVAIGLNDRFLLTRELFNNNSELFKITVSQLNNMASFDAAKTYLSTQFNWDYEDPTTEMFMQIIKRRYL